jgi:16S rRNA (adenine1518-N6/adenine1519-N6)-dimethyltransferase
MASEPTLPPIGVLLKKYGLHPDKNLGQNFLTDPNILNKIITIAGITNQDAVLEIGAGLGHLTLQLAQHAGSVTAVELDKRLIFPLQDILKDYPNTRIIQGDILQLDVKELIPTGKYQVVANIPYYITSQIIRTLLENRPKPQRIILTIQREVAERICASDGKLSVLALSVLIYGSPTIELTIPAGAFFPVPKVDSAVVLIKPYDDPLLPESHREIYFKLIKAGFKHKRKTIKNSFTNALEWPPDRIMDLLQEAGINPQRRAETLSLEEWLELTRCSISQLSDN